MAVVISIFVMINMVNFQLHFYKTYLSAIGNILAASLLIWRCILGSTVVTRQSSVQTESDELDLKKTHIIKDILYNHMV